MRAGRARPRAGRRGAPRGLIGQARAIAALGAAAARPGGRRKRSLRAGSRLAFLRETQSTSHAPAQAVHCRRRGNAKARVLVQQPGCWRSPAPAQRSAARLVSHSAPTLTARAARPAPQKIQSHSLSLSCPQHHTHLQTYREEGVHPTRRRAFPAARSCRQHAAGCNSPRSTQSIPKARRRLSGTFPPPLEKAPCTRETDYLRDKTTLPHKRETLTTERP